MKYEIGQDLWYVPFEAREKSRALTIVKIGREWLTLSGSKRADKRMLTTQHAFKCVVTANIGQCYVNRAEYEQGVQLKTAWGNFRRAVQNSYKVPENATVEGID